MQIEEVVDLEQFAALKPRWKQLIAQSDCASPFQTWEWNFCSWKHFGRGELFILVAKQDGEIVAIMPLTISRGRHTAIRRIQWIGQMADYQDLIALPEKYEESTRHFFDYLSQERGRWDFCELTNIPERAAIAHLDPTSEIRKVSRQHYICPLLTLESSFEKYLNNFSSSKRKKILRFKRRLQKELNAEFVTVESHTELDQAMHELFELHSIKWEQKGSQGKFFNSSIRAFHLDLATHFLEIGILKLHRMKAEGKTRAILYGFHFHDRFYGYLKGYDPAIGKYSPGMTMIAHSIDKAIEQGAHAFEFLSGGEPYKYFWNAQDQLTERLTFTHQAWRSKLASFLYGLPFLRR